MVEGTIWAATFRGKIRKRSMRSGHYWIQCRALWHQLGVDATIKSDRTPTGLGVGDSILFQVAQPWGARGGAAPIAFNVRRADAGDVDAESPREPEPETDGEDPERGSRDA